MVNGPTIQRWRKQCKLRQADVAERAKVSRHAVMWIECERYPFPDARAKILRVLKDEANQRGIDLDQAA